MAADRPVLHLISQAHLDPVWLWPLRDGVAEVMTTVQSAVDRCRETPSFKFTRSSAFTYRALQECDPRLLSSVRRLVGQGRWEDVGGWIEQPDANLPSTESFIRQGLYGRQYLKKYLRCGGDTRVGYCPDSFGHGGGLPQILTATGFDSYVFMRPEPIKSQGLPLLFWWESPDGSRVLACRIPVQYSQSYAATADQIEESVRNSVTEGFMPGFRHGVMWFGIGNHGGGPTREHIKRILELQRDPSLPEIRFSTVADFLTAIRSSPPAVALPVIRGDLGYVFRGCYSANGETKRQHRQAEQALFAAESLEVMRCGHKADPGLLRQAWWRLLFNQFHDVLAGTCVASVQEETRNRFGAVLTEAKDSILRSVVGMSRKVDTRREKGSVLFAANSLPWRRRAFVTLDTFSEPNGRLRITHLETEDGRRVPIQWMQADANFGPWGLSWGKLGALLDLPGGGYRTFRMVGTPITNASAHLMMLGDEANRQFSATPKKTARRTKTSKRPALRSVRLPDGGEMLAGPVGTAVIRDEGGTWGHGLSAYNEVIGQPQITGTETLEDGPLVRIVRQKSVWKKSEIWMDVMHYAHTPVIGLRLRVNWQERREILKLLIKTKLTGCLTHAKMPGAVATRPADGHEYPCHDWVALAGRLGGNPAVLALLNDSSYSYDAKRGDLRMVLARGVPHAEHPPFEYTDTRNVLFLDQGWQEKNFWLIGARGSWKSMNLERLAREWQSPAEAIIDSAHPGTEPWTQETLLVEPSNVSVLAIKPSEKSGRIVLRIQEFSGRPTKASVHCAGRTFSVILEPWQIATLEISGRGKAAKLRQLSALEERMPKGRDA
jgi:alpha-mannosidase